MDQVLNDLSAADHSPGSCSTGMTSEQVHELLDVHDYERRRMGRDLHDHAGQLVISLELSLAHLKQIEIHCGHQDLIEEIQETVRKIDNEIRTLAFLDYPAQLGEKGLYDAIRSLAREVERRTGMRTTVETVGNVSHDGREIGMAILRVVQEALANIHRHAHASLAKIVLKSRPDALEVSVQDNGIGMAVVSAPEHPQGIGLRGMRHRVEELGGSFKVTRLKQGTRISASVPFAA